MTIAILCPTRARPGLFRRMVDSAFATAHDKNNIKFYVALRKEEMESYEQYLQRNVYYVVAMPDGLPTVFKWNTLAEYAQLDKDNKLFMLAGDDMIFSTPLWDKALLELYDAKPHIYSLLDSRSEDGTPHPIATREYIETMGYFLPPCFLHWFVDTWTVGIAKENNCFTHLKDYMLVHEKPWDKGIADETHNFIHQMGWLNSDRWTDERLKLTYYGTECQRLRWKMMSMAEE